jgi:hypothetical protein
MPAGPMQIPPSNLVFSAFLCSLCVKGFSFRNASYIFSNSRRCLVCARLTGTSEPRLSFILSM